MSATAEPSPRQQIAAIAERELIAAKRRRVELIEEARRLAKTIVDMEAQLIAAGIKTETE